MFNGDVGHDTQCTVARCLVLLGEDPETGLASSCVVQPGRANQGIVFRRADVAAIHGDIPATVEHSGGCRDELNLRNRFGYAVCGVAALLIALRGLGIDNATIALAQPRVPYFRAITRSISEGIADIGVQVQGTARQVVVIRKPVSVQHGHQWARLEPSSGTRSSVSFYADLGAGPVDVIDLEVTPRTLEREVRRIVSPDEDPDQAGAAPGIARQSMRDALADLALIGSPLLGRYSARGPDHRLNRALLRRLLEDGDAWGRVTTRHSYLSASIGSSLDALRAG